VCCKSANVGRPFARRIGPFARVDRYKGPDFSHPPEANVGPCVAPGAADERDSGRCRDHEKCRGGATKYGASMNDRSFHIAPAAPDDVADVHALIAALASYERLEDLCVSTQADIAAALFGGRPAAEVLIARINDDPRPAAGFALFFYTFSTFTGRPSLWLEDLFVRPERRGLGIGKALLAHLAARARQRNCARFEWAVLDWNESAVRFYESLGARMLPDWRICRMTGDALDHLAGLR
jgi:GNAT superfamily N-acetyltransferase